eukprot:m51a1_g7279 hypothetical protein (477) ;mRNA; r:7805-9793
MSSFLETTKSMSADRDLHVANLHYFAPDDTSVCIPADTRDEHPAVASPTQRQQQAPQKQTFHDTPGASSDHRQPTGTVVEVPEINWELSFSSSRSPVALAPVATDDDGLTLDLSVAPMSGFDEARGRSQRKRPREQDDGADDQRPLKKRETGGETSYSEQEQCDGMDTEAPTFVPTYTEIENAAAFGSVAQSADEYPRPSDVLQSLCVHQDTATTQQATAASSEPKPEPEPEPAVDEQTYRSPSAQPLRDPKPEVDYEQPVARSTPHEQTLALVKDEEDETQTAAPEAVREEATAQVKEETTEQWSQAPTPSGWGDEDWTHDAAVKTEEEEQPEGEGDGESDQTDEDEDEDDGRIHVWVFEDDDPTSHEGDEEDDGDDDGWRGRWRRRDASGWGDEDWTHDAAVKTEEEEQPEGEGDGESDQTDEDEDEDDGRIHVWVFEDDDPTSHEGDEEDDGDDDGWRGRVPDPSCYSAAPAA